MYVEDIVRGLSVPTLIIDSDHEVVEWNKACEDLTGVKSERVIGTTDAWIGFFEKERPILADLVVDKKKNDLDSYYDKYWEAKYTDEGYTVEITTNVTGEEKILLVTSAPVYDPKNNLNRAVETIGDVTERRRMRKKLKERKSKLESVMGSSGDSIYMVDENCRFILVNDEFLSRLGKTSAEVEGEKFKDLHSEEKSKEFENKIRKVFENGEQISHEYESGNGRCFLRTLNPVRGPDTGEIKAVTVVSKDITDRKKAEERQNFLHSLLRHDLRNKIQVVLGYLQLLEDQEESEKGRELIKKSIKGAREGIDLIEKVRKLREAREEEKSLINLNQAIEEAVRKNKELAEAENMEIEREECKFKVYGSSLLEELISNIIENSVKHSRGSKIKVSSFEEGDKCVLVIEDDGKGVPDNIKDRIFEKGFKRGETANSGLGLKLVKDIAEKIGGEVRVDDSELGGAKFEVELEKACN